MSHSVVHFAIHAEDCQRARAFYEAVFQWYFEPWGPPNFYLLYTGGRKTDRPQGALQLRHEPLTGSGMRGFECTVSVSDLEKISAEIARAGGTILHPATTIPGVGRLIQFSDTEGNIACAMQYEQPFD